VAAWGWFVAARPLWGVLAAVAGAGVMALVWGLFVAPKAASRLADPSRFLVEVAVFGVATLALAGTGRLRLAIGYGALSALSLALMFVFRQRGA